MSSANILKRIHDFTLERAMTSSKGRSTKYKYTRKCDYYNDILKIFYVFSVGYCLPMKKNKVEEE